MAYLWHAFNRCSFGHYSIRILDVGSVLMSKNPMNQSWFCWRHSPKLWLNLLLVSESGADRWFLGKSHGTRSRLALGLFAKLRWRHRLPLLAGAVLSCFKLAWSLWSRRYPCQFIERICHLWLRKSCWHPHSMHQRVVGCPTQSPSRHQDYY